MMKTNLNVFEISTYFVVWVAGVFYAIYQVYLTGNLFNHNTGSDDFVSGWWFLNRQKDISDYEWRTWLDFIWSLTPWIFVHVLGAELTRHFWHVLLPMWYLSISFTFTLFYFGIIGTAFLLAQPCIFYILLQFKSRTTIWLASFTLLAILNVDQTVDWLILSEDRQYLLFVCIAWTHLRCLSYCFDQFGSDMITHRSMIQNWILFLSYVFYLPVMFLGPLILYFHFSEGLAKPFIRWNKHRWVVLAANLSRFLGWLLFTEFALHYIYCNAIQYQPEVVALLGPWALCGLGYCMGQFFMNKYVVVYGLPATIARAEQISAPNHPKCIARIHLYSDMWKHFDRGLYSFLVKYIYVPCLGTNPGPIRQLFSSFICFCFIYVWHRTYLCVFVWSVLNFLGVTVESVAKSFALTRTYQHFQITVGHVNMRRFHALIASPLFAMSCVSNFYFFGGMEIGNVFAKRFCEDLYLNSIVLIFCYCCCQVSIEVKNWEATRSHLNCPTKKTSKIS